MLRIEHEADQELYTKGDRAACIFVSLASFIAVVFLLVAAWIRSINATGYWNRPVKEKNESKPGGYQTEDVGNMKHEPVNIEEDDE